MNIKSGKIRDLDPTTVTVALMMTTLTHMEISQLIDKNKPLLNHEERSRAQAKFWFGSAGATDAGLDIFC